MLSPPGGVKAQQLAAVMGSSLQQLPSCSNSRTLAQPGPHSLGSAPQSRLMNINHSKVNLIAYKDL